MTKLAQQHNVLAGLLLNSVGQRDTHKEKLKLDPNFTLCATYTNTGQSNKKAWLKV